jgi:hypothetical protein
MHARTRAPTTHAPGLDCLQAILAARKAAEARSTGARQEFKRRHQAAEAAVEKAEADSAAEAAAHAAAGEKQRRTWPPKVRPRCNLSRSIPHALPCALMWVCAAWAHLPATQGGCAPARMPSGVTGNGAVCRPQLRRTSHAQTHPHRGTHTGTRTPPPSRPSQVGPFDHTPKRPPPVELTDGQAGGGGAAGGGPQQQQPMRFWDTEEGIVARGQDAHLAEGAPRLTRRTLPPRLPPAAVLPSAPAPAGVPSSAAPGVYFSDHPPRQQQQQQQQQQGAGPAAMYPPAGGGADGGGAWPPQAPGGGPGSPQPGSTGRSLAGRAGGGAGGGHTSPLASIRFAYPELGHGAIPLGGPAPGPHGAPLGSTRSPAHDVYGQPRTLAPLLPRGTYVRPGEEAEVGFNDAHLDAEGDALRSNKTSSSTLLRLTGGCCLMKAGAASSSRSLCTPLRLRPARRRGPPHRAAKKRVNGLRP